MNKSQKIILLSVLLSLTVFLAVVFVIYYLYSGMKLSSAELNSARSQLLLIQDNSGDFQKLRSRYNDLLPITEKIDGLFADPMVPVEVIQSWERAAEAAGLEIEISPGSSDKGEPWDYLRFTIILTGPFKGSMEFIDKLESGPYLAEITSFSARRLTSKETSSAQFLGFVPGDGRVALSVKVFTK